MLKPADTVRCAVAGLVAGAVALFVCLTMGTDTALTAVIPVGFGVGVQQVMLGVFKRRAWQRENAERA